MKERTIGSIVLLVILIGSLLINPLVFSLVMTLAALLGFRELVDVKYGKREFKLEFIKLFSYISIILITLNKTLFNINNNILIALPILGLTIPIVFYNNSKRYNIEDALYFFGSVMFLSLAFQQIIRLCNSNIDKCIYVFLIAFITDTYAYISGNLIGKHNVTEISPKKTWEGSIIGSVMGCIIGSLYYYNFIGDISILRVIMMSFTLTIFCEVGDLVFSSIKRYFNKKDYSNLIPGHGGILDRFDSVIFVALGLVLMLGL